MSLTKCRCATAVLLAFVMQPLWAADDEMFDWAEMARSVAGAAKLHTSLEQWKGAADGSYQKTYDLALKQVTERCPSVIERLPEEARPGLDVNFDKFCECYDTELVDLSMSAMFESNRMGENGKTMAERRAAWEDLFDIPHENTLGGCVVKTTQMQ